MSATVHTLSRRKVDTEATTCANLIYDAQAVVRVCMAVIDEDNGVELNRHTVWRALSAADRVLQEAGDKTGEIALSE